MPLRHGTIYRVMAWLGVRFVDDHRSAVRGDSPAQAFAEPEPLPSHDGSLRPVGCYPDQLVALDQPQPGAFDVEQVGSLLRDPRERLTQSRAELGSSFACHRVPRPAASPTGRSVLPPCPNHS